MPSRCHLAELLQGFDFQQIQLSKELAFNRILGWQGFQKNPVNPVETKTGNASVIGGVILIGSGSTVAFGAWSQA